MITLNGKKAKNKALSASKYPISRHIYPIEPFGGQLLPFLKKKQDSANTGLIVQTRAPDESDSEESEDDSAAGIESCAHALINAVHSRDAKAVASAMKDAFDILESGPHEEYESKHDYDSQNIKAAEEQE